MTRTHWKKPQAFGCTQETGVALLLWASAGWRGDVGNSTALSWITAGLWGPPTDTTKTWKQRSDLPSYLNKHKTNSKNWKQTLWNHDPRPWATCGLWETSVVSRTRLPAHDSEVLLDTAQEGGRKVRPRRLHEGLKKPKRLQPWRECHTGGKRGG